GSAFIYSPAWLEYFGKVQIRRRHTFDSAATPKLGDRIVQPKTAAVDLKVLEARMAATIEKVKSEDPKELQRRIRELEAQLKKGSTLAAGPALATRVKDLETQLKQREKEWVDAFRVKNDLIRKQQHQLSQIAKLCQASSDSVKPVNPPAAIDWAPPRT